ncbi:MAG: SDR family NAD(P)-dependent oxidoreductase, partial [Nanopusillaceae archaeon]
MSLDKEINKIMMEKAIVLMGVTGGIGKMLAKELKRNGYYVVGNGRKENVLEEMKKNEIIDDYVVGDLTKKEDREKIIEKIINLKNKGYEVSIFYNLGILVPHSGNFADYKEDNIDLEYETNVKSIVKMDY